MRQESPGWITEDRVRVCGATITVLTLMIVWFLLLGAMRLPDLRLTLNLAGDFRVFYAAAQLALSGDPIGTYDPDKIFELIRQTDPALTQQRPWFGWFYPPTFLLAVLPLALLPWLAAYFLFIATSFTAYLAVLRKIAAPNLTWWFVLGFPPVLFTFASGQNAFLTAALAGAALIQIDRRPTLSGLCIGLLALKPQLAVLFPIVLAISGRWRVFTVAAITAIALFSLSILLFGAAMVPGFLGGIRAAQAAALDPLWPLEKMPTLFACALAVGVGKTSANYLHLVIAVFAGAAVALCWRRDISANLRNAVFVLGTLLVSPHLFDYDLTWLALPIIWMAAEGLRTGWHSGERAILCLAWLTPLVQLVPAALFRANLTPVVLVILLAFVVIRARRQSETMDCAAASQLVA